VSSALALPIYRGEDFYVPEFEVRLRGRPLPRDVIRDVTAVTYKDALDEIDSFEITINNWDAEKRDFKYADSDLFDPGKQVEVSLGYFGRSKRRMITGEITSLKPTFPAAGQPTLGITGLSLLHRLRTEQVSETYEKLTDTQIARRIEQRLGVKLETDAAASASEQPYPYIIQDNQYDIVFLMERARRIGYDLFVEEKPSGSVLYFGPSIGVRRATYRLTYGRSLVQFTPNLTTANQVAEVTVRGWDNVKKKKIEATAKRSQIATKGVGAVGGQSAIEQSFNQRKEILAMRPIATEAEARKLAVETLERIAKDMVTGSGTTVGLPDLRAGCVLELDGLGERFSGRYFVTSTSHAIGDGGYTTSFDCRREEL
jgi:phage protein D